MRDFVLNENADMVIGDHYNIILENSIDLGDKRLDNVERVSEISGTHFTVYKNLEPAVIVIKGEKRESVWKGENHHE